MIIYSVESFEGAGYELVIVTYDENKVMELSPSDYDTNKLMVKKWIDGEVVNQYIKEITFDF